MKGYGKMEILDHICCSILQTGHITPSSTTDRQLENHSTKYHRQQPLYNTLELLMMGIVVPETCWASSKNCNKNLCCIYLAFYFYILTTMHGQNHIKFLCFWFQGEEQIWRNCRHLKCQITVEQFWGTCRAVDKVGLVIKTKIFKC